MAKRYTDSEKWKKPFIRAMRAPYKLLWLYIIDECNHAGIWQVDMEVAELKTGEKLKIDESIKSFGDKIIVIDKGEKWFIPDFINFQYGLLNIENRVHKSVIDLLNVHNLLDENYRIKTLASPLEGAMDKDKDKDKDKDNIIKKGVELNFPFESEEFKKKWAVLAVQKKWKGKSKEALQESLYFLSKYTEQDAIEIMSKSIAGGWQGLFELDKKESLKTPLKSNKIESALQTNQEVKENLKAMFTDESNR